MVYVMRWGCWVINAGYLALVYTTLPKEKQYDFTAGPKAMDQSSLRMNHLLILHRTWVPADWKLQKPSQFGSRCVINPGMGNATHMLNSRLKSCESRDNRRQILPKLFLPAVGAQGDCTA